MVEPIFPQNKIGMFGVYVQGSGVHGYFENRNDAVIYQKKMHNCGCYYVSIFQYGDESKYWNRIV